MLKFCYLWVYKKYITYSDFMKEERDWCVRKFVIKNRVTSVNLENVQNLKTNAYNIKFLPQTKNKHTLLSA